MAKFYTILFFALSLSVSDLFGITKTWVGPDAGLWNDAANWSPVGVPTASDDVVIDGHFGSITVNSLPVIRSLSVINGSAVTFAGNASNQSIFLSCATCNSLIEAGSAATFTGSTSSGQACSLYIINQHFQADGLLMFTGGGSNNFIISAGNVIINGDMVFSGNGTSRLVCNGGVTTINGRLIHSANSSVASTPLTLFISASGTYQHARNGGTLPAASWDDASTLHITGMTDASPSFTNISTLGVLFWECPQQTLPANINKNLSFSRVDIFDTGASEICLNSESPTKTYTWMINGEYTQSGGRVNLSSGNNGSGKISFKGTNFYSSQTLTETSAHGKGIVEFCGAQPQIAYFGNIENTIDFTITTADRVLLNTRLTINDGAVLTLNNGHLVTSSQNLLTLSSGATVAGGSVASHIKGPLRKAGNAAFTFPIGKGTVFAPLSITAPAAVTDTFTAEYFNQPPANTGSFLPPLVRVSHLEYWQLTRQSGSGPVQVTLNWQNGAASGINDLATLATARYNGASWVDAGGAGSGTVATGSIQSDTTSAFGWFSFGARSPGFNPLPVTLKSFSVSPYGHQVRVRWATASEQNNAYFGIERSADGQQFEAVGRVDGAGRSDAERQYAFTDAQPLPGLSYYRLRQVDFDNAFTFSPVRPVDMAQATALVLFPSPATSVLGVRLAEPLAATGKWCVYSASGQLLLSGQTGAGNQDWALPVTGLDPGTYIFRLESGRVIETGSFLKR